jgi:hypothetical protein
MWKFMRSPRASNVKNLELLLCTSCSPRSYQAEKGVSGSEIGVYVCEQVCHQVQSTVSLRPHEVNTDEKKQKYFLNGLNDGLAYALEARDFENF